MNPQNSKYTWFQLMWKNGYIQIFIVAIIFLMIMLYYEYFSPEPFYSTEGFIIALIIPIGIMILIGYKAFYQFWNDYKQGKSR